MHPVRLRSTVRHQVAAHFSTGGFHGSVGFALGNVEALGENFEVVDQGLHRLVDAGPGRRGDLLVLGPEVAPRHEIQNLLDNAERLPNLVQANGVPVKGVAVSAHDDVKLDLVVGQVRLVAAQVPGVSRGAENGTSGRKGQCLGRVHHSHPLKAFSENGLAGQQSVVFVESWWDQVQQAPHVGLPTLREVSSHPARTDVVVVHPEAGDLFEEAQHLFTLSPAVDHHRHGAEVHAIGGLEQQVGGDPV